VQFGSRVTIRRRDGSNRGYRIVEIDEADPKKGTLYYVAPLAQALIGKEIGDSVVVEVHEDTIISIA
jgi:transcription elongation GreA/GreB family factor